MAIVKNAEYFKEKSLRYAKYRRLFSLKYCKNTTFSFCHNVVGIFQCDRQYQQTFVDR